jgi:hypothetical protein
MTDKNEKKLFSIFKTKLVKFGTHSTIHGMEHIFSAPTLVTKVFWVIAWLISFSLLTTLVAHMLAVYLEFNVVSDIEIQQENSADFPTVSFCSEDVFAKEESLDFIMQMISDPTSFLGNSQNFGILTDQTKLRINAMLLLSNNIMLFNSSFQNKFYNPINETVCIYRVFFI